MSQAASDREPSRRAAGSSLQPKTLGDNQLFRDFVVRLPSGELAYVEAKNWQHIYNKTAIRKLRRQFDSHFTRLRQPPPEPLLNVPPGKALVFYFNTRARGPSVRADWVDAIRRQAVQTLQIPPPNGYGFSRHNAETWVSRHLSHRGGGIRQALMKPPQAAVVSRERLNCGNVSNTPRQA